MSGDCPNNRLYFFTVVLVVASCSLGIGVLIGLLFYVANRRAERPQQKRAMLYLFVVAYFFWGAGE
jgi:hypothetical protein